MPKLKKKKLKVKTVKKKKTLKAKPKTRPAKKNKKVNQKNKKPLAKKQPAKLVKKSKLKKKVLSKKLSSKKAVSKKILRKKSLPQTKLQSAKLSRALYNPIIEPRLYPWESRATLNPAAFESGGKIHIIYRAIGEDDVSVLGYASTYNGHTIHERPPYVLYKRTHQSPNYNEPFFASSGGGWCGGCEDPRVALIDGRVYLMYVAFDGWSSVRMALTSISLNDFKHKKWNRWEKPVLISPPGEIHKNWVLFPEKINGKFAILHSHSPRIMIDYFDSLDELDGKNFIKSISHDEREAHLHSTGIRGIGPTPIKTKDGWLVIYHKTEPKDRSRYKMFAKLLDLKDPTKVLYHGDTPILEPEEHYENHGHKWGVIYSCGAVVKDGELFVYYGGADKVICVASIPMTELLTDLKKNKIVKLKSKKILPIK